ncbi:Trs65p Ecym_8216 [Eremothecium cymbalariae DBVPG|uniref:Uncharacterized protein n=1 Tax=Eremothecium cymbalariae (strain CBS 270.75 / DBVPG 7215 / KCTC 17166 / NRRL Y-17582) TaxID=931890 RepID=G8JXC7_ERECY|nr:Hypothetical protein Ecym_8216 [Eremothecium cymbalariae DBVPG\
MELLLPVSEESLDCQPLSYIRALHELRQFLIFDEDLAIYLHFDAELFQFKKLTVYINEAIIFESHNFDIWQNINGSAQLLLKLDSKLVRHNMFRTNVVMNNGNRNKITFQVQYTEVCQDMLSSSPKYLCNDDLLPSFEQVRLGNNKSEEVTVSPEPAEIKLQYNIHSLLNVRLRKFTLKSKNMILSSLDFQTSKLFREVVDDPEITVNFISYELIDGLSSVVIEPLSEIEFPLVLTHYDSYSINYGLSKNKTHPHRGRIVIKYQLKNKDQKHQIITSWDTDLSPKKPVQQSNALSVPPASQPQSYLTPYMGSVSMFGGYSQKYAGSTTSLQPPQSRLLSNVVFKFINHSIVSPVGCKFSLHLQIHNSSLYSLNLVVYYSSLRSRESHDNRRKRIYEGIILLSNDFKVPIIEPGETYELELSCIGIIAGYYNILRGLKVVDLGTKEVVEIGRNVSILIK